MKNSLKKIDAILALFSGILLVSAMKIWAPSCQGMLKTDAGNSVFMKCHYFEVIMFFFGILLIIEALVLFRSNAKKAVGIIIIATAVLMLILCNSNIGIGVCQNAEMMCHKTLLWARICSILGLLSGVVAVFTTTEA